MLNNDPYTQSENHCAKKADVFSSEGTSCNIGKFVPWREEKRVEVSFHDDSMSWSDPHELSYKA